MNPRFPLYIVSKGRHSNPLTARALEAMHVPYSIVVEEPERDLYSAAVRGRVLALDPEYQRRYDTCDELGDSRSRGPGPARNFVWDHAIADGHSHHWVMDDNIKGFFRFNRNLKTPCSSPAFWRCMEDFVSRYENVTMAGPNYFMFVSRKSRNIPPFVTNTRVYSCVAPETPILCADLVWRRAECLASGQRILAFDSEANPNGRGRNSCSYRTAVVERNEPARKPSLVVSTDIGIPIRASTEHLWLVKHHDVLTRKSPKSARKTKRAGDKHNRWQLAWAKTSELQVGDKIAHLARPWVRDETHEGGWIAGMYDGEGCCTVRTDNHGIQLAIAQRPGPVFERLKIAMSERGFKFGTNILKSGVGNLRLGGGFLGALRFAGEIAPTRLIARAPELWESRGIRLGQSYEWSTITSIDQVGVQPVAEITTSTGTFITGGYLTHNCNLIRNSAHYRWRGHYNEDTDLSLRMLKDGWCTIQFNAFLQYKLPTQQLRGGNTDEFYNVEGEVVQGERYARGGTLAKSQMQVKLHPDVSRLVWRFGRWHHHVDYSSFKGNKLRRRADVEVVAGTDDYGMELRQL